MEETPQRCNNKRGPYRKYLRDISSPIPKTTKWRTKKRSTANLDSILDLCTSNSPSASQSFPSDPDPSVLSDPDPSVLSDADPSPSFDGDASLSLDANEFPISPCSPTLEVDSMNIDVDDVSCDSDSSVSISNSDFDSNEFDHDPHSDYHGHEDLPISDALFEPLYDGANITICGAYCAIMEYKRTCKLPFTAIEKLLELLQQICPVDNSLPKSVYLLKSFFQKRSSPKTKQKFCPECSCELASDEEKCNNSSCHSTDINYLYTLRPEREIRNIVTRHWKKMDYSLKLKGNVLHDIHAGKGYKKQLLTDPYTLGTVFNTDGIQPFKSSRVSIWPVFLAFSNLPPNIRMNKDNLVTVVLWVGSKPPMKVLFKALQQVMGRLQTDGFTVDLPTGSHTFRLCPLFGVFDLIAKAPALNMMQHNGRNGCSTCLHPGESCQRRWVYLPNYTYPERTHLSVKNDASAALRDNCVSNGIKGISGLADLVDLVDGIPIDYMHCVLEGVTKRILEAWVKSNGRAVANVDVLLLQQRPPHEFSRPPRSILKHRKYWKASEYRNWLLYYSLPLLSDVLPPLYLHHFALLVCSIHILLQDALKEVQIQAAEDMLESFYVLLPELYGNACCTLNSHLLIHLPKYVRLWGPLWTHSAFGFESLNGHITSMITSKYKIAEQLLYSIEVSNTLTLLTEKLEGVESEQTLEFLNLSMSSNCQRRNMSQLVPGTYSVGPFSSVSEQEHCLIKQFFGCESVEAHSFYRLYHNDTLYYSVQYGREGGKRNSTACCYKEDHKQRVGIIQKFVATSESVGLALITPLEVSLALLKTIGNPGREILRKYSEADLLSIFVFPVKKTLLPLCTVPIKNFVCKCVMISCDTTDYVIKIPNNFEHH